MFAYLRPVRLPRPLPAPAVAVLPCSVKTKRRFKERETRLTSLDIEMSLHLAGHTAARGTSSTAEAPVGHWHALGVVIHVLPIYRTTIANSLPHNAAVSIVRP